MADDGRGNPVPAPEPMRPVSEPHIEPTIDDEPMPEPERESTFPVDDEWRLDRVYDLVDHLHPMLIGILCWMAERGAKWSAYEARKWNDVWTSVPVDPVA